MRTAVGRYETPYLALAPYRKSRRVSSVDALPAVPRAGAVRLLIAILCGMAVTPKLAAAEPPASIGPIAASLERCLRKPENANTMATNGCYDEALSKADRLLDMTYEVAVARLKEAGAKDADLRKDDSEIQRRLAASQRAWIAYREAECSFKASDFLGGSGAPALQMQCQFDQTRDRIKRLDEWLKDDAPTVDR